MRLVVLVALIVLTTSCAPGRDPKLSLEGHQDQFHEQMLVDARSVHRSFDERLAMHVEGEADGTFDILALSGGGPLGAFGAGFLQGWKDRPEEFDVVTGVSTGARPGSPPLASSRPGSRTSTRRSTDASMPEVTWPEAK